MLEAVVLGQESYLPVIDAIITLAKKSCKRTLGYSRKR
jgi:hypothetical protein